MSAEQAGEYAPLTEPASPGDEVALGCPLCGWRSEPMVVEDRPNGTWHALFGVGGLGGVGDLYRTHFAKEHRPPPLQLVRADHSGSPTQDGSDA